MDKHFGWKVYPNPFNESFTVETKGYASFSLYNIEGRMVDSGNINTSYVNMGSSLSSGLYLLKLQDGHNVKTFKLKKINK